MVLLVSCRPFDPELYEDEGEDDDVLDEEGRARLKLKVRSFESELLFKMILGTPNP